MRRMKKNAKPALSPKRLLALSLLASACGLTGAQTAPPADGPLTQLPYTPSLDVPSMDRSVDPCEDFYQYACGGWMANNPIPDDQSRWAVYSKMANENQRYLWSILDKLANEGGQGRSANQLKMGDYFAACMDEKAVNAQGLTPLQPQLQQIAALSRKKQLPALLAQLHLSAFNERFFFAFNSGQDFAKSTRQIAFAYAGGISLPDRDYYLKRRREVAPAARAVPGPYRAHVRGAGRSARAGGRRGAQRAGHRDGAGPRDR